MAYFKNKNYTNDAEKVDYRQELADKVVERMKEALEYKKGWLQCNEAPFNRRTGRPYTGSNFVTLVIKEYVDPRYLTFHEIQEQSKKDGVPYSVRRQKATILQGFFQAYDKADKKDAQSESSERSNDDKTVEKDGKPKPLRSRPFAVFNCSQIEGFPKYHVPDREFIDYQPAELLIECMKEQGVKFEHHGIGRAYYVPSKDEVWLPHKELFKSEADYYRTAMHELGHATGHESRLNRDQTGAMKTNDEESFALYAYEELVAELSSYIVGAEIGVPYTSDAHENHGAYMKHWIAAISDKKDGAAYFAKALKDGGKAADFKIKLLNEKLLSLEASKEVDKTIEVARDPIVQPMKEDENVALPLPGKKPVQSKMATLAR